MLYLRNRHTGPYFRDQLRSPDASSFFRFNLHVSGGPVWSTCWERSEQASGAYTVKLDPSQQPIMSSSVRVKSSQVKRPCLFVASAYATPEVKDNSNRELSRLLSSFRLDDVVVVANLRIKRKRRRTSEADFSSQPLSPMTKEVIYRFVLTAGFRHKR